MKIIAIGAVTAGEKKTVVKSLIKRMPKATSLHFDNYSFEGEVDDFHQWVIDRADYKPHRIRISFNWFYVEKSE